MQKARLVLVGSLTSVTLLAGGVAAYGAAAQAQAAACAPIRDGVDRGVRVSEAYAASAHSLSMSEGFSQESAAGARYLELMRQAVLYRIPAAEQVIAYRACFTDNEALDPHAELDHLRTVLTRLDHQRASHGQAA